MSREASPAWSIPPVRCAPPRQPGRKIWRITVARPYPSSMILPPSSAPKTDLPVQLVANRYTLVRPLGAGSFGRTFLARDNESDRMVAIKVLDKRAAVDWKAYEMFEREAAVLRSLRHHGVPEMFDLVTDSWEGAPAAFLIMEYVEGMSLARMIDESRPRDSAEVMHLVFELLGVLDYLHSRVPPILHRDIKPANIIIRPDGTPVLVDFGSVRRVFLSPEESGSTVVGTYGYMPYEQYMGQATAASDLYALGATFLHLVTGRAPREFMNEDGRIQVPDDLPGDARLRPILARLLRPSPAERFASAREVRDALLSSVALAALPPGRRPVTRAVPDVVLLGPAPRPIEGGTAVMLDRTTPTMWQLLSASSKSLDDVDAVDLLFVAFLSVVTAGILPITYFNMARAWRKRLRRFFRHGVPAMAEVVSIEVEKIPFDEKLSRVTYQFEADGELHRGTDLCLRPSPTGGRPATSYKFSISPDATTTARSSVRGNNVRSEANPLRGLPHAGCS